MSRGAQMTQMRIALWTTLAMIAFASNSLLNRLALGGQSIDAISYTAIRLVSGALMLFILASARRNHDQPAIKGTWISAGMLFLYAIAFSFAYLKLTTGTGALLLFGSVQVTMILYALWNGERPHPFEWSGLVLALGGLVYLVFPGLSAPEPLNSALMILAGVAWGFYTLRGRGSQDPLADTAGNFIRAVPMALPAVLFTSGTFHLTGPGVVQAVVSGALASGVGYVIWYAALRGLTTTRAATVQLSVPVIAAWSGVVLLNENVTSRLVAAGIFILGGIGLALFGRQKKT